MLSDFFNVGLSFDIFSSVYANIENLSLAYLVDNTSFFINKTQN
jgi:hypothetical protein